MPQLAQISPRCVLKQMNSKHKKSKLKILIIMLVHRPHGGVERNAIFFNGNASELTLNWLYMADDVAGTKKQVADRPRRVCDIKNVCVRFISFLAANCNAVTVRMKKAKHVFTILSVLLQRVRS